MSKADIFFFAPSKTILLQIGVGLTKGFKLALQVFLTEMFY